MDITLVKIITIVASIFIAFIGFCIIMWVYAHLRDMCFGMWENMGGGVNPNITSNILYNTSCEMYLNIDLCDNYAYWDTTGRHLMSDRSIEILQERLLGITPTETNSSLLAMFPLVEMAMKDVLIVPSIHFKRKNKRVKHDFINAYKFDGVEK